jgi:hypothetical protein
MSEAMGKRRAAYRRALQRVSKVYRSAALLFCNTLVLLVVLNAMLSVLFHVKDALFPETNPAASAYHARLKSVYPTLSLPEIRELMADTWGRRVTYDSFAQFREAPYAGKYVNVHEAGFRVGLDQGPWPPAKDEIRIFMFGGSTLFGYGLRDEETISSQLQQYLGDRLKRKVSVYNFAQGSYFSTQERAFFEQLLLAGHAPDIAIFVDGLNEFCHYTGEPAWTQAMRDFVNRQSDEWSQRWIYRTSLARLALGIRACLGPSSEDAGQVADSAAGQHVDPGLLEAVGQRYLSNKRLIEAAASAYGVRCAFVWQPIPTYHYDSSRHLFLRQGVSVPHRYAAPGYALMATRLDDKRLGRNFLWLADIQQERNEPLYVDQVHYTAGFSKTMAEAVGEWLIESEHLKAPATHK